MVGATGIEPVTPTMSTKCVDGKYSRIPKSRTSNVPLRSRSDHGNLGRFLGLPGDGNAVVQRDDGLFALGLHDDAPAFPSRRFAEQVRLQRTRHDPLWVKQ